jgi:hypothetical protein
MMARVFGATQEQSPSTGDATFNEASERFAEALKKNCSPATFGRSATDLVDLE